MAEQRDSPLTATLEGYDVETLKKAFEDSPVLMCLLEGPQHRLVYINRSFRDVFNSRSLQQGRPARDVWPELMDQDKGEGDIFERMDQIYKEGESTIVNEWEIFYASSNSGNLSKGYFNLAFQPLKDDKGLVQGLLITGQDVTKRVNARKAKDRLEKRFHLALEGARLGFFEVDAKGESFTFLSDQAKKHLGYSPDDPVTYEDYYSAVHPDDLPRIQKIIKEAVEESVLYEVECRVYWPDGSLHWILIRGYVITDEKGRPERRIGIAIDISEQKANEKKLKEAVKVRDDFLSIASHELQTPVTSIKTRAELFEIKLRAEGQEEFADEAAKIGEQIDQLGELADNLLDISKLSEGELKLEKEWFSLKELIQDTIDVVKHLSGHEVITRCETEGNLYGDRYRIEQVLLNLLKNAIKYSSETDDIIIEQWEKHDKMYVSVTDFGIGITDREKNKIFNRFYRGEDSNKDTYPGIGVGLYISQEIIQRHGGTIKVKSNKEQGSKFTFTLPKRKNSNPKAK